MKNLLTFDLEKIYKQVQAGKFKFTSDNIKKLFDRSNLTTYSSKQLADKFEKIGSSEEDLEAAIATLLSKEYYTGGSPKYGHRALPTIETVRHLITRTQKYIDSKIIVSIKTTANMKQEVKTNCAIHSTNQFNLVKNDLKPEGFQHKFEGLTGSFKDYKGDIRNFIMVAVSVEMDTAEDRMKELCSHVHAAFFGKRILGSKLRYAKLGQQIGKRADVISLPKGLYFGISVTKPEDNVKYDEKVGLRIALGRALNANKQENVHAVFATHPGMFSAETVKNMLVNEAKYFAENPGSYMTGYYEARDKYLGQKVSSKK